MSVSILHHLVSFFKVHSYSAYYYGQLIERRGIYFQSPHNHQFLQHHVRRPLGHVVVPAIVSAIFSVRCLIVLTGHPWDAYMAMQLLPSNGSRSFEFTLLAWSLLHIVYSFYVLTESLVDYKVMAPLMVRFGGPISWSHLGR